MAGNQGPTRRSGIRRQEIVWNRGGTQERVLFLLLATFAFVFLPLVGVWLFVYGVWQSSLPFEFAVTLGLAVSSVYAFFDAFFPPLYRSESWGELLRQGYFSTKEKLATEYLHYLETHGREGRLPGAARWAFAYWGVFYGLMVMGIAFANVAIPLLGWLTPALFLAVDAPVVYSCRLIYRRRMPILYGRPDPDGFQLSEPLVPGWLVVP